MEPVQLAAVLAAVVLAREHGLGRAGRHRRADRADARRRRRQRLRPASPASWLDFIATFASIVLTFLAGMEVDPDVHAAAARRLRRHRRGLVHRPVRGRRQLVAYFLLDWTASASLIAGTALSTTSLAVVYAVLVERGLTDDEHRQAADERHVRDRPVHGARAVGDLHQAERLVPGLPRRLGRADPRAAAHRALVLRPLRRPRDRAGDQARVRLPARADGARRRIATATRCCRRSCSAS